MLPTSLLPAAASSCDEDSPLACSPGAASPASGPHQALFARELAAAAAAVAGCRLQCGDAEDGAASAPCTPPNAARPQWRPATRPAWCCAASPTDGCSPSSEPGSSSAACYQQQQQPDATRLHARHARPALHASSAAVPWPVVHSFADVASRSPLVKSALSALSMDGTHPTPHGLDTEGADERDELRWTLAQLLALHLRAGLPQGEPPGGRQWLAGAARRAECSQPSSVGSPPPPLSRMHPAAATEASILAALWVLESLADTSRSSATVVLDDYLAHLAAFSPLVRACLQLLSVVGMQQQLQLLLEAALPGGAAAQPPMGLTLPPSTHHLPSLLQALMALTADWEASFVRLRRQLAAAQADLLQRCGWRLRLDFAAGALGWAGGAAGLRASGACWACC